MSRAHSPTLLSLHVRAQLILQLFRHFIYITAHSPTLPFFLLHHSSFSNPSLPSPTSQALHLHHVVSCPWVSTSCLCSVVVCMSDYHSRDSRFFIYGVIGSETGVHLPLREELDSCLQWRNQNISLEGDHLPRYDKEINKITYKNNCS